MQNITYKFGNNFENDNSAASIAVPAMLEAEGNRGTSPAKYVVALEEYVAFVVPANVIINSFYLVVSEAMVGTVSAYLGDVATGEALFTDEPIDAIGIEKSIIEVAYVTTPDYITLVFSDAQTAGLIQVAFDVLFLDTNNSKYLGS